MDFSIYSPSSEFDLDFTFRSLKKGAYNKEEDLNRKHFNSPESLLVLTAKGIALHFPFEVVESSPVTVPEELQRLIAFHSFPTDEDDIWLYSCLSSGGSYEFDQGEALWADKAVKECVQIGILRKRGINIEPDYPAHRVSLTFDRQRITSCSCTCTFGTWCSHVVATCLMRIRQPDKVLLRAPISESLSKLSREDLQKFAQNLICHVGPRKILPAAQLILDQLLAATNNPIKNSAGAPDPTVGGALGDAAAWCFDGGVLEEKLRVTLRRFWAPRPVLYSDIGSLSFNSPTEVENFHCILRSYRANEPRGLWALLSFIRDMMKRQDNNGVLLLEIVTRCILDMNEVMFWWCTVQTNPCHFPESVSVRQKQTQCVAVWLCEEIVQLWSLACLNPELRPILNHVNHKSLSPSSSCGNGLFSTENCKSYSDCCWLLQKIAHRLQAFHAFALKQADIQINLTSTTAKNTMTMVWCDTLGNGLFPNEISSQDDCDIIPKNISLFSGFLPALAACSDSETTDYADVILNFSKHYYNSLRSNNDNNNNHSDNCPVELDNYWSIDQMNSQLLNNLPLPENHIEFAFIRFQALNTHGYTEQALHWARFLALLLLYTSNEFINECEQASFEIVGRAKYQSSETNTTNHVANISRNTDNSHRTNLQNPCPANYQSNSRGQQKSVPTSTVSSSWSSNGIPGGVGNSSSGVGGGASSNPRRNSRNGRSRKTGACSNTNNPRETTEKYTNSIKLHPLGKKLSIDYTKKAIRWLDQIRCIMECLSNAHKEQTNNIDLNKSFDIWECIDIELIFRLGFCALKFPRPPCCSPLLEVKLFVIEIALLTRLCFLPIHIACPHVISSIRSEAKQLVSNLTLHQKDIHVPFNLATYLFHQLVGVVRSNGNYLPSQSVNFIPPIHQDTENVAPNINISLMENFFAYPVLSTGAVLAGSGLPLAMDIYNYTNGTTSNHHLLESEKNDHPINVRIASDGELGLQSILSVLGVKSRVPERLFTYFIEGQRTQEDALAVYLFRMYRDDISKLDRIRARLLDRYYNPYFKSPPLWACLSLGSRELMNFQTSNLDYNSVPEVVVTNICPNSNNTTDSSDVDNITKLSENDKQYAPANNGNNNNNLCSFDPLSISEDTDTLSDSKLDNLHCTTLYDVRRKISRHLNTIDTTTSAPETTSSDNSPAVTRRLILIGAKSSEAQTTESSDGGGGCGPNDTYIRSGSNCESRNDSKFNYTTSKISMSSLPIRNLSTAAGPYRLRIGWHSHLKRPPPQPLSDSMAFHAFQLAETIRECAGGPSTSGSMFVAETEANDTVHRNLQLISFQLGLYGLGLFNRLLPSWQNRTFSRNGGWISQQVFEIGIPAACILYHSWQQHLTAAELTAIAFQLSRANNRSLVDVAAELCLASLSLCTALKPQELYRALEQCGEHSSHTLERGLLCVERSAYQSSHDILPEIYFFIARSWYTLYHSTNKEFEQALNSLESSNNSNQSSLKIRNDNENLSTFNKNNTMNTILSDSNIHVYPNLTNSVQELTNNDINSNSSVTNNNCDIGNSATINTTITTTTNNSNNSITGMSLVSDSNHATSDNKSNNNNPINSINLTSNGLVNAWYYYQSVNLLPPPVVRGDQQPHHQHQEQPNQLMYGASMLSPVNFNYSGFPLGQQQHQYTSLPYYMNMLSLQTPQSLSQQQTNNNNLLNNNSPQLQSTTPPTQRQQQSAHPPPPHHHLPYYLPQSQHMMSPIQSNVPYSFGMSSLPPVGLVQSPNNYFLHPQFIPNTPLPTPSSSQSINMIPSGPFVTIPHHINPSTSLSPTFGTNVLPCNSYQAYSTDQVMEPSLYGFNPAMTAPTVHQSMVCNVLGTPPQSQVQQQQHQTVEPVTSLASINTINNIHSTNNNYVNNVNLNTLSDSTVISVNSLSSVISSALTSTRQLTTSNTASSSVVVHPSMSDQGSIISEGDSCRLAESVADGLGDENNPYSNNSNSSGDLSLNSNNNNKEKLSSNTAKSTVSELQSLKLKAQAYLIRAFFCAKCAIKKISASQSNVNTNFTRQNPIAVSMPSRSIRGKHHHYHMQQSHRGNSTNHSQRRHLIQTDTNSNCMLSTSTRNTITTNDQNNCLPSENSSSMFLMPGVSSSCRASNQVRISSANVISDFNLINATTTSTTTTTTSTTNANSKSCSAHILWTLDVASSLGPLAVNEYCDLVLQCVNCPLLMEQITSKVIDYFEKYAKTHTPSCSVNNGRGGLAHMQQPYIDVSSPNAVISDNNDKNVNFCSNISQNFLNQSHTPNQPWTTSIASVTPVSNWPTNSNPYDLHDVVHPLISLPFPHSDPNNINSTFNYHSFIPPSILPPNNPSWSHPSVRPVSYPILRQNLSSKQLHENLYRFKQMNLNYEPNINASPYILSNNKLNNLNVALNQLPFYNQQTSLWPMNPLSYILPVPVPPPHTVTPSPLTHHQNDMYRNSVMTTTTTGTLGMHHNSYTTTDESIKQKPLEFSGRDVIENLINHTHTLFQKYIDQRLQYIGQSQAEWDEFVDLILKAYNVHLSMPAIDCGLHWNNLLTRIRRHQKCSPALWQRILAGIQTADLKRST
ncbi:putative zinc finger protein [Schistosoma mansoni]|uniref:putative zinc finger protein n=1 Tax=Schistosoma mansoni TaxID=6183 RepID=UPI0001A639EE|nr:putative zinc finger protein [Schistosoma mansoni]|eukprot:XP_018654859.1 putative zinc finger protein [Schistosoma mansoni]